MNKEFKTIDELVSLLASRNVIVDAETGRILQKEGYYAIVNGYKDTFLDRDAMQSSSGDVYRKGTTFRQIYDLFLFDRDMRNTVFPYLMKAESILKNAAVYAFCNAYRETDAYLERSNYTSAKDMLFPDAFKGDRSAEHGKNLADLMRRLNGKLKIGPSTKPFIRHYLERYGMVPLWVLQNDLTFGNIEHFYQLQKRGVQNHTCRIVSEIAGHGKRLGARDLLKAFVILVGFRNICAHEDRCYCASVKGAHVDEMLNMLFLVLPRDEIGKLGEAMHLTVSRYIGRIDPRALNSMYTSQDDIPGDMK